jgi:hypothetical protein
MIRTVAPQPYKEYRISSTTTPLTAIQLAYQEKNGPQRLLLEAVTDRVTVKFGDSTVLANKTVTSSALPDGNFSIPAGAIFEVDLPTGNNLDYISIVNETGAATLIARLCQANV